LVFGIGLFISLIFIIPLCYIQQEHSPPGRGQGWVDYSKPSSSLPYYFITILMVCRSLPACNTRI
jgi:hypothetical protein